MTIITTIIGGGRTYRNFLTTLLFIFTLFILTTTPTQASFTATDFITTWDTENTGTSASNQITIPGTGAGYSYSIYWESLSSSTATGTIATSTSASQTITFPEPGQYKVAIKGTYPRIYFNNGGDKLKILTVEQWGSPAWTTMQSAFYGCANLTVPATDAPNLSGVTIMNSMFQGATSFNNPVNHWDVSNVTTMRTVFFGATSFNQSLNNWNTASVTDMYKMFLGASMFNGTIGNWNVSKVLSMRGMFAFTPFNQNISMWNTASNTDMSYFFQNNTAFNQDISNWNTSNVTQMEGTFQNSDAFSYDITSWDTTKVTDMAWMFFNNNSFNQDISNWNTASVTTMYKMFENATAFDQDLSSWNMTSISTSSTYYLNGLQDMFLNASLSTQNLDSTLTSWAAQSLQSNVPFHLGLKTYSSTGATALDTLRDTYNWTITEQYKATYQEGDDYILNGTITQSPITSGSSTTAVEVIPNNRCTFINWSDGNTTNPRTDTLTDNLTVSANVECHNPTTSTNVKARVDKLEAMGNEAKAEALRQQYHLTPNSTLHTAIATIATLTTNPTITNNPETKAKLITIMQTLVVILEGMRGE
jgi:surface protein